MNGRIKPRFEDLASATLKKPKIVDLPRVILEPNDHTQVLADFKIMSDDIKKKQYDAAATQATAAQIAHANGVPVQVALHAMADMQTNQAAQLAGAIQVISAADAQHRHELLMQDRLFGQTALKFRHLQQLSTVAQQVTATLPSPPLVDASGDATMAPETAAAGTPGADTLPPTSPALADGYASAQEDGNTQPVTQPVTQAAASHSTSAGVQPPTLQHVASAAAAGAAAVAPAGQAGLTIAIPGGDDGNIEMTDGEQTESAHDDSLKSYEEMKAHLIASLGEATTGNHAGLKNMLRRVQSWFEVNAKHIKEQKPFDIITLAIDLRTADMNEAVDLIEELLLELDMDTSEATVLAIATGWNLQPDVVAALAGTRKGKESGTLDPTGEDRGTKPKTSTADHRSGVKLPVNKQREQSKAARTKRIAGRRASGASSSGQQSLDGGPVGVKPTRPYVNNPPPSSNDPNHNVLYVKEGGLGATQHGQYVAQPKGKKLPPPPPKPTGPPPKGGVTLKPRGT